MAARLAVYDPENVIVSVGGADIHGWADGSFVSLVQTTDDFSTVVGSDGEVVRSRSNDHRATLTLTLTQTSDSNDVLSAIANADRLAANGAGVAPLLIRDKANGRALYTAAECWIAKMPDVTYDRTATGRAWKIEIANLIAFSGGST